MGPKSRDGFPYKTQLTRRMEGRGEAARGRGKARLEPERAQPCSLGEFGLVPSCTVRHHISVVGSRLVVAVCDGAPGVCHLGWKACDLRTPAGWRPSDSGGASGRLAVPCSCPPHAGPVLDLPYSLWAVSCVKRSAMSRPPAFAHILDLLMTTTGLLGH